MSRWLPATRRGFVLGAGITAMSCSAQEQAARPTPSGSALQFAEVEGARYAPDVRITSFRESPELAACVARGELPPVAERIGRDPLVIQPLHEIGRYGGIMRRAFVGPGDYQNPARF